MDMIGEICASPHLDFIKKLKLDMGKDCKVYVEIGVLYGGSMIMMMNMDSPCLHIGIDPFAGYYGKSFDPHRKIDLTNHYDITSENIRKNNKYSQEWKLIKGKSDEVKNEVIENIDFLFIDGDHSREGVINDFNNYSKKVNIGGLIVFDNYSDPSWTEVKEAVDLLCDIHALSYKVHSKYGHCLVLKKLN
mgnify:FL=1|tara:strand:+ start:489 stop:1058 length:570 start_codon:yes stop_codon:yes gene_type:complete